MSPLKRSFAFGNGFYNCLCVKVKKPGCLLNGCYVIEETHQVHFV